MRKAPRPRVGLDGMRGEGGSGRANLNIRLSNVITLNGSLFSTTRENVARNIATGRKRRMLQRDVAVVVGRTVIGESAAIWNSVMPEMLAPIVELAELNCMFRNSSMYRSGLDNGEV